MGGLRAAAVGACARAAVAMRRRSQPSRQPAKKKKVDCRDRLARGARAGLGAPRPAGARPGADAGQSRSSGLVLPATSKFLIDDVIGQGARRAADAAGAGGRRRDARPGGDLVRALAGARRRRAARDHRHAAPRRSARRAPAGPLLRLDAGRRPDLAHHDRRRGHPEPRRHRPGPAHRQHRHRGRSRSRICSI